MKIRKNRKNGKKGKRAIAVEVNGKITLTQGFHVREIHEEV